MADENPKAQTLEEYVRSVNSGKHPSNHISGEIQYTEDGAVLLILDSYERGGATFKLKENSTEWVAGRNPREIKPVGCCPQEMCD